MVTVGREQQDQVHLLRLVGGEEREMGQKLHRGKEPEILITNDQMQSGV